MTTFDFDFRVLNHEPIDFTISTKTGLPTTAVTTGARALITRSKSHPSHQVKALHAFAQTEFLVSLLGGAIEEGRAYLWRRPHLQFL